MARAITEKRLMNVALFHLKRFSASQAALRRVLERRVYRWGREGAAAPAAGLVDGVVAKLVGLGYLDDQRLAHAKAGVLRRQGRSTRVMRVKLAQAGLARPLADEAVAATPGADAEAIWVWARRKRLGVFRIEKRAERRDKDLAALVRAGFSFRDAKQVVDAASAPDP